MEPRNTKATGVGAQVASQNTSQDDYAPSGNLIQAHIDGQRLALTVLDEIRGHYADPDALYLALKTITPDSSDIEALATMRGFMRILQKQIERSAA